MSVAIEAVGTIAAMLTTIAYVPQSLHTLRTRSTGDISLKMLVLLSLGLALWIVYGVYIVSIPVIGSNILTLALVLPILYFKLRGAPPAAPQPLDGPVP